MKQSKSIIAERQNKLYEFIQEKNTLTVSEASRLFNVSELTIRRDFDLLESQQLIVRFHGGAALNTSNINHETYLEEKKRLNEHIKDRIGQYIATLIPESSTIFLNSGTTTLAVLKHLNGKKVRVITNNALAPTAVWSESIELILTGGECRKYSKSLVGSFAINVIHNIYSNYCILGANGISENGTTTSVYTETPINEAMVTNCNGKVIIVADGSKIGKSHNFFSIPTEKIDMLITDPSADPEELRKISNQDVEVVTIDI